MKSKSFSVTKRLVRLRRLSPAWVRGTTLAALACFASATLVLADDTTSTNAPVAKVSAAKPGKKSTKKISGVELYAIHCNRCHPERYPVELNETQWKTIMLHMRVRANLPADQARTIMKYLQEEAGN